MKNPGFIIGGGPSLSGFDFERLRDHRCLAINAAFKDVPWAKIAYIGDTRLLDLLAEDDDWAVFPGKRFTRLSQLSRAEKLQPAHIWSCETTDHWVGGTQIPRCLVSLGNAGLSAINLAEQIGWDPIFLLGFDAAGDRGDGRMANYHDFYPKSWAKPENFSRTKFQRIFDDVKDDIYAKVYNCNPMSALECFEKITFEEAEELCSS